MAAGYNMHRLGTFELVDFVFDGTVRVMVLMFCVTFVYIIITQACLFGSGSPTCGGR